jgi:ABC-type sulfate/molybdate transport systems ATPase subunit
VKWRVHVQAEVGGLTIDVDLDGDERPTALVGPNGSGKTSLLRTIVGARRPRGGRIEVADRPLFDADSDVDLAPEERHVGYVPQGYGLFPHLRVLDNVAFGLATRGARRPVHERRRAARAMLDELGCGALAARWPRSLSGGERQRVALARALVVDPHLLLLDEPLSALDASSRRQMRTFLASHLAERGKPSLIVTHDLRDVLALDANVFVLEAGRVVQRGTAAELAASPKTDFVAELFELAAA